MPLKPFQGFVERRVTSENLVSMHKQPLECSLKKGALENFAKFTVKHPCQSLFFNKVAGLTGLLKKEALAQVFSCEFCKNTSFTEHLWTTLPVHVCCSRTYQ